VLMPVMAVRAARSLSRMRVKPTVQEILLSTLATHGVVGGLAVGAAWAEGIELWPRPTFGWLDAGAAAAFLVLAGMANLWRWHAVEERERDELSWLRPQSPRDFAAWAGISLLAGVTEEVIYRGVLLGIIEPLLGSYWPAVAVCVLVFALGHWAQGRGAMLIIVFFALAFHVLVRVTGDLYTAIAVHVAYDFGAGVLLWAAARPRKP
jgi:membrane protease YdiL (CAAX protease family)